MFSIQMMLAAALGNGTRQQHDVLARVSGTTPEALTVAAYYQHKPDLAQLPGDIELADGVEPVELFHALRNPQLLVFAEDGPPAAADLADQLAGDQDEPPTAPKPKPPRPPRPPRKRS